MQSKLEDNKKEPSASLNKEGVAQGSIPQEKALSTQVKNLQDDFVFGNELLGGEVSDSTLSSESEMQELEEVLFQDFVQDSAFSAALEGRYTKVDAGHWQEVKSDRDPRAVDWSEEPSLSPSDEEFSLSHLQGLGQEIVRYYED